ncbi:alpha/beta hydrolase [Undibacterium sp. SXout20W]|uniref:alpha/beta hydrolase n=1 Tax=Undibacterium sp. SXout20W TaxID=3413051 RepID=UPI003BF276D0
MLIVRSVTIFLCQPLLPAQRLIMLTLTLLMVLLGSSIAHAQQSGLPSANVPTTISWEAQQLMQSLSKVNWASAPDVPASDDVANWKKLADTLIEKQTPAAAAVATNEQVKLKEMLLGGVPVLEILPKRWRENHRVIVFFHGGAYTLNSARSRLAAIPPLANATGMRIISVDYTRAPIADWRVIQSQALAVIRALLKQGYAMKHIALLGESAGGGLATSTALNVRDAGLGEPGAVVLWSPWVDLTDAGDTSITLKEVDPILNYEKELKSAADAYAGTLALGVS